ncbi:MAG: TlpA family protein disulfide reductase [Chloroflexi bacterium]|nr:TlpA family protein disulfide reductase [Chloroflexota bacterium]
MLVTFVGWAATNNAPADDPVAVPLNVESREAGAFLQGGSSRRIPVSTDFTLMLFDGKKLALSDLQGKPVVLNFWASWCPPCRAEARGLERVWQAYKDKDIIFLGVDIQDNEADARAFLKEFGVTYPNGQDTTNEIAFGYGVSGIPTTVLITRDGRVARRWVGAIGEKQLAVFIEEML